ncbi:hypothetical protein Tco_0114310 [Tanacetum coccineum]
MHIRNDLSFFLTNNTGAPYGDELGRINLFPDNSCNWSANSFSSDGANRYGARATGAVPSISSILNSTCRGGGSPGYYLQSGRTTVALNYQHLVPNRDMHYLLATYDNGILIN